MPFSESRHGKLLRIFIGDADTWHGKPLYQALVEAARKQELAGATVIHGVMGFGAKSHMHSVDILRLSTDLPVIIEIVDLPERIEAFMSTVDTMVSDGMVTIEDTEVLLYRRAKK